MKQVYLIGNAHIDPVWLWRKGEGMAEVLSTFRSALDRMNEFPDYVFTCACAYYYQYVADVDPDMMREIRARVQEGRWNVVGGAWVQTDMNIPGAEAFARQELYSQRTLRALTGRMAKTGYCVDSFGHNGMIPQLLRQGRMENYVFMRPESRENAAASDLMLWRAPDGSQTLTYRIPNGYGDGYHNMEGRPERDKMSKQCLKAVVLEDRARDTGVAQMAFYGVGNHGGGPTIEGLKSLDEFVKSHPVTVYAGADEYFGDARADGMDSQVPVWTHDLQHHASGCYTANVRIKGLNRRAENVLNEAERFSLMAKQLVSGPDERARITKAWKKVMFNQFHDVLAGCTLRSAAHDAEHAFHGAIDEAEDMIMYALERMARRINTTPAWAGDCLPPQKHGWLLWQADAACPPMLSDLPAGVGAPVIVFNPHSFPVHMCVKLPAQVGGVMDADGHAVSCQRVRGEQTNGNDKYVSLMSVDVPALGWATYYIYADAAANAQPADPVCAVETEDAIIVENAALRAEFDKAAGHIRALTDKRTGNVISKDAARAILIDDSECDTWSHNVTKFDKFAGEFALSDIRLIDNGPLRASVRVVSHFNSSEIVHMFTLDSGEDMLRCHVKLTLNEHLRLIKLCFPSNLGQPRSFASMPGGFIEKVADGREQPSHKWAAQCGGGRGLAVLNDGRYGVAFEGGEIRLAIARSALFADHFGSRDELMDYIDIGETELNYALTAFDPDKAEHADARAELLNMPVRTLLEGQHKGKLPCAYEGAAISGDTVRVQAIKRAENGEGFIVRLNETAGKPARAHISIPALDADFDADMRPMGISTYYVKDGKAELTDFVEPD